jgi:integrase
MGRALVSATAALRQNPETVRRLVRPPHTLQLRLVLHTARAFCRPINPHLFRDCVATSIAIHDPKNVRMAATILGHQTFAVTERHYNLARTLEAGRSYTATIGEGRRAARRARRAGS